MSQRGALREPLWFNHLGMIARGFQMLVLSRKVGERIVVGDNVTITVVDVRGDKIRLGIEAPKEIPVHRQEVYDAIKRHKDDRRAA